MTDDLWAALAAARMPRLVRLLEAAEQQPEWWAGRNWRERLAALAGGATFQAQVYNRELGGCWALAGCGAGLVGSAWLLLLLSRRQRHLTQLPPEHGSSRRPAPPTRNAPPPSPYRQRARRLFAVGV